MVERNLTPKEDESLSSNDETISDSQQLELEQT